MLADKIRRQIAFEAARLLLAQQETDILLAKRLAARRLGYPRLSRRDFPTHDEVREQLSLLGRTSGGVSAGSFADGNAMADRFTVYASLLRPLAAVRQRPEEHPEGDVLYHSLQVFELARHAVPYDEEFLLAALLHDVGKGIDPRDPVPAALAALQRHVTSRTAWLIENLFQVTLLRGNELGMRGRKRLEESENFDDLELLDQLDRQGRQCGAIVPDMEEALQILRDLASEHEESEKSTDE